MRITATLCFIFVFFLNVSYGQILKDKSYYTNLSKGLGYYYSVELSLSAIRKQHPSLALQAQKNMLDFRIAHGPSVKVIESILENDMNIKFPDFKLDLIETIKGNYNPELITYYDAENYLLNFEGKYIYGNDVVNEDFVKILLRNNPEFKITPILEFTSGYKQKYNSNQSEKTKCLSFSIELPKSWTHRNGNRPNILALYKSFDSKCIFTFQVRNLKDVLNVEKFSLSDFLSENFARQVIDELELENTKDFNYKNITIDGQRAIECSANGIMRSGDNEFNFHTVNYVSIYNDCLMYFSFFIKNEEQTKYYKLLSEMIVNSIIIEDKWK